MPAAGPTRRAPWRASSAISGAGASGSSLPWLPKQEEVGPDPAADEPGQRRREHDERERQRNRASATKAATAIPMSRGCGGTAGHPEHGRGDDGQHGRGDSGEERLEAQGVAEAGVDRAERHQGDEPGQHEEDPGDEATEPAVEQPAEVDRELLSLGSRQQHAVVQGVQEPAFAHPAKFVDQLPVHHRDLSGRAPNVCSEMLNHARVAVRSGSN